MDWFYALPAWLGLFLTIITCVAVACAGHVAVRRYFQNDDFIGHNDVAGFIVAVVGVMYAVLLAFLTVIVWEHFAQAEERAQEEVNAATAVWRFVPLLPAREAREITDDLGRYTAVVVNDEWPKMRSGKSSIEAQRLIIRLIADAASAPANGAQQSNLQNHLLDRVQTMADLRRHRINDSRSGIPTVLWVGLLTGAATLIGFLYLFVVKNFTAQLLMTAATAAMIGISFGLILELDYPFRGHVSVSPERWVALHEEITRPTVSAPPD